MPHSDFLNPSYMRNEGDAFILVHFKVDITLYFVTQFGLTSTSSLFILQLMVWFSDQSKSAIHLPESDWSKLITCDKHAMLPENEPIRGNVLAVRHPGMREQVTNLKHQPVYNKSPYRKIITK